MVDDEATDDQFYLDASAYFRVFRQTKLYATAQNVLDSAPLVSRRPTGARPGKPRFIQLGVKQKF